jgi:erythromycin esterase-like protein
METATLLDRRQRLVGPDIIRTVHDAGLTLPAPEDAEAFGPYFDRVGDAKVVLLGESTHGTAEFYRARAAITRRLVERHGFSIVALEADWPDTRSLDREIRQLRPAADKEGFQRFPTWMWRNVEFEAFVDWLREHNSSRPMERKTELRGLDIYSLGESIGAVLTYLDRIDPSAAKEARQLAAADAS